MANEEQIMTVGEKVVAVVVIFVLVRFPGSFVRGGVGTGAVI